MKLLKLRGGRLYDPVAEVAECLQCRKIKPYEEFSKRADFRRTLPIFGSCKKCINTKHGDVFTYIDGIKFRRSQLGVLYNEELKLKKCSSCGKIKHTDFFHSNKKPAALLGKVSRCKVCENKITHDRSIKEIEKISKSYIKAGLVVSLKRLSGHRISAKNIVLEENTEEFFRQFKLAERMLNEAANKLSERERFEFKKTLYKL